MYRLSRTPQVVAHRGFSGAFPENTRSAILGAIDVGADMVEIDVRLSSDGVPVIYHDKEIGDGTSPSRYIDALSVHELRSIDLGLLKGSRFKGESILTLDEALALVRNRIPINLDIKAPDAIGPVVERIRTLRMGDQVVLSGCMGGHVRRVRRQEPHLHVLMNVDDHLRTLLRLCSARVALLLSWLQAHNVKATGLNIGHHIAADEFIRGATARNLPVWAWTVDDPARALELVQLGAVSITSNQPQRILSAFGRA
jgi:glycerophosphoryl diester phosphodiesterase